MANYFIAGVMTADLFAGDQLFATAKTLIDSSISINVDSVDVQAGEGYKLFGKYFHSGKLDMKFTDAMWRLDYVAKNVGGEVTIGGDAIKQEQVILGEGKVGTVSRDPVAFGEYGIIGWVSLPKKDDWYKVTFDGKNFISPVGNKGDKVCIKYFTFESAARKLVVDGNIIPSTIHVVGKAPLYAGDTRSVGDATKVGYVQFDIPRFILSGSQEISMSANGVGNTPLQGSALAVESEDCEASSYYAIITEIIDNAKWYDNVEQLSISGGSVDLEVGEAETLGVLAISNKALPFKPPYADIVFSSNNPSVATVGEHTGEVVAVSEGEAVISVVITDKPEVQAFVKVNVTT